MLNNNINPMMNNINQNIMMNQMMNDMYQNNMINPMMNNMNQNMMLNPNMNNMNMMIGNMQMNKEINFIIISDNKIDIVSCFENDNVDTLKYKIKELNNNEGWLIHNYQPLDGAKSLKDNGIVNGSIIYIKSNVINIIFKAYNGISSTVALDEDCPLHMAIIIYGCKSKIKNFIQKINKNTLKFIYNNIKLRLNDETPIKIALKSFNGKPIVTVEDTENLIGG